MSCLLNENFHFDCFIDAKKIVRTRVEFYAQFEERFPRFDRNVSKGRAKSKILFQIDQLKRLRFIRTVII